MSSDVQASEISALDRKMPNVQPVSMEINLNQTDSAAN